MALVSPGAGAAHRIGRVAAHVPDLVVYGRLGGALPYTEHFTGVLLFADVSGFTALTEKFSMVNKKGYGADRLTSTLNKYIGDIVHSGGVGRPWWAWGLLCVACDCNLNQSSSNLKAKLIVLDAMETSPTSLDE